MAIEFIGTNATSEVSETVAASGPQIQPDYCRALAVANEEAGFDRVLVAQQSFLPDPFIVADQVLSATSRLGVLLAHRTGFIAPTISARKYATLDAFHPGRVALHAISGGDDADQDRDGDFTDKAARYRRTDEFLDIVEKEWSSAEPFDYEGEFYRVKGAYAPTRPPGGHLPIYFGGASEGAIRVGGRHADVWAFLGEPLSGVRERIGEVQASASAAGRKIERFSVSLRPIVADTEQAAWARAEAILEVAGQRAGTFGEASEVRNYRDEGQTRRLLGFAEQADVHDKRLWTALAKVTGAAGGNSTALVGSYEQVAESLLDYIAIGVTSLLFRGFELLDDTVNYGPLITEVRERLGPDHGER